MYSSRPLFARTSAANVGLTTQRGSLDFGTVIGLNVTHSIGLRSLNFSHKAFFDKLRCYVQFRVQLRCVLPKRSGKNNPSIYP